MSSATTTTTALAKSLSEPAALPAPVGRLRRRTLWIVGGFVVFQLLVPLTYYFRDDPYDERFAWRMFSAVRLHSCSPSGLERTEDESELREVNLERVIHRAWINTLARNRSDVIESYLRQRCEEDGVVQTQVRNQCVTAEGERVPAQVYTRDCATGAVELPELELGVQR